MKNCLSKAKHSCNMPIEQLYFIYYQPLLRYARLRCGDAEIAKDIVQQVFLKLLEKDSLQDIQNKEGYLFMMVRNEIMNMLRSKERGLKLLNEIARRESHISPHDALQEKEYRKLLKSAVERLPARRKLAYQLNFELGWNRDEIAARLNISPKTAKNLLQIARADVREFISSKVA